MWLLWRLLVVFTVNPDLGMVSDQGAVRCGPPMSTLWQLIKDVGVKVWQQSPSQMVYITEDGVSRFNPTSLPTWNPLVRLDHHNVFSTMDRLANQIPPEEPWEAPSAQEWDSCTMKDFFDRTVWFKSVRRITDAFVRAIACAEPEEVSMLWFLWLVGQTGGGRWATLVNPNPPQFRVSGGMQHLCKVLAEQLGDKVTLNCPITKVENVEDGALVTSKEATWEAKAVILAVPPPCYSKISLSPALPEAFHHITMGRVYRCTLYYKTNFWGNGDRFVQLFADYPGCLVVNAFDDTVPGNKYPAFTATLSGRNAIEAREMTKEQSLYIMRRRTGMKKSTLVEVSVDISHLVFSPLTRPLAGATLPQAECSSLGQNQPHMDMAFWKVQSGLVKEQLSR